MSRSTGRGQPMADTTSLTIVCQGVAGLSATRSERGHEFREVRERVVRTRRRLGVVLHRKERQLTMANALDRSIVQVEVGHLKRRSARDPGPVTNYRKAMVLRSDENLVRAEIPHRVVAPSVSVRELGRGAAVGEADQLMAQADAEGRKTSIRELADGIQRVSHRGGITRPIGKKKAVWL
jgi:hypothetical protein